MANVTNNRPYTIEYCHEQSVVGRGLKVEKIRRTAECDPIPDAATVLAKLLPNTFAVIYGKKMTFVEIGKSRIYLVDQATGKKILLAKVENEADGSITVGNLTKKIKSVKGIFLAPIYPWGENFDMMFMYLGKEKHHSLHQLPKNTSQISNNYQINLTKKLLAEGGPVYWGSSNSSMLMSIPWPHLHISKTETKLTHEQINSYRNIVNWDNGLSRSTADYAIGKLKKWSHKYRINHEFLSDNVGFSVKLPDFSLDTLLEHENSDYYQFIKKIHRTIDRILIENHNAIYDSKYHDLNSYISHIKCSEKVHHPSCFTDFFKLRVCDLNKLQDHHRLLYGLHSGEMPVRKPGGWASLLRIEPEGGATLYIMFTFIHELVGPFEGIGIKLKEHEDGQKKLLDEYKYRQYLL